MKTKLQALELLLKTYQELNRMKACEQGEKSHALWQSTDFIRKEIKDLVKSIKDLEEY